MVILLLAAVIGLLWLLSRMPAEDVLDTSKNTEPAADLPTEGIASDPAAVPAVGDEPVVESPEDSRAALKALAMSFTERYGSYSNESGFENLLDLIPLMSQDMAGRTESFVGQATAERSEGEGYAGISTRSMTVAVDGIEEESGEAKLTVTAQRRDISGGSNRERVYYQALTVEFIRINGSWKVDSAVWQEEGMP